MLIDFFVENYGPFRDRTVLDLRKSGGNEQPDNTMYCEQTDEEILRYATIFGKNSSGKSYILKAIRDFIFLVESIPKPNAPMQFYKPFRLSNKTLDKPTVMGMNFVHGGVPYRYVLSYDANYVVEESLHHSPNGRMTPVFERHNQTFNIPRSKSKALDQITGFTLPNAPFLTVAAQFNNKICSAAHLFLTRNIMVIGEHYSNLFGHVVKNIAEHPPSKEKMIKALTIADFGICDIRGKNEKIKSEDVPPEIRESLGGVNVRDVYRSELSLIHEFKDADVDKNMLEFPHNIESTGTIQMFCIMGPVIDALENGKILLIDEFGSSLHTELSRWIISQFKAASNPKDAQLIVNTHDLMLIDTDSLLRRDQIMFSDKDVDTGAATIYRISDYKGIRKDMDILKSYMAGRFGALPYIDGGDII